MKKNPDSTNRFRILKGGKISLVVSALLGSVTLSFAAPSGGNVVSGSATISQSAKTTNINQSTGKASINWNKFSIASDESVNFNQPNINSITLNRVIGNERSIIDGALNANGQVWLLNSNGVLFGKNASINTSGLLATTKELSDTDFQNSNYSFKGNSTNSIINEGTITVQNSGYVILASNEVRNSGTIEAVKGNVRLSGANEYTINLNGNSLVDLTVDKGVLDALVKNSGTIAADGGEIYLTTNAVNELLRGVVNNTGVIEANSIDGVTGYVELFAHGGTAQIGGTIKAEDGFVETSGKELSVDASTKVIASKWLLDPVNMTIENTGGSDLSGASVSATAIQNNLATTDIELQADEDITVNENITWGEATKLTLTAGDEIYVNSTIENTNSTTGGVYFNAANTTDKVIFGGSGKVIVNNVFQLQWINQALDGKYELGSNIDASGIANFNPIGKVANRFRGSFDGLGHTISDLTINRPANNFVGLFGGTDVGSVIKNIGLVGGSVSGADYVGGLVGYNTGTTTNSYATGSVSGTSYVGGLVGWKSAGTIQNSYATGSVSGTDYVGGLVGYNSGTTTNSYATGSVSGTSYVGGLVGWNNSAGTTTNSYWDTQTTGQASSAGGTGLTTAQMIDASNFSSWSTSIWSFGKGSSVAGYGISRPYLTNVTASADIPTQTLLFNGGYGTSVSPYTVTNWQQLQNINYNSTTLGKVYNLSNDLGIATSGYDTYASSTANSGAGWNPIGDWTNKFEGSFDGLGHTISDLTINRPTTDYVGLFGATDIGSVIKNIGLVGGSVSGQNYVGSLAGYIYQSSIKNSFATGNVSGNNDVGGLAGLSSFSSITNSFATGNVSGNNDVGGLAGYILSTLVDNTYATGNVSGTWNVGGLVGHSNDTDSSIINSYAMGSATGTTNVGGLLGRTIGSVSNSYWNSTVNSTGVGYGSATGVTGLSTAQMQQQANFTGFDFTNDWVIYDGHTNPLLRAFMTELTVTANDATKTYDGNAYNGASGVTYSVTPDANLLGTLSYTGGTDAGTYTITPSGLYSTEQNGGYAITYIDGSLTINQKTLTVTGFSADNKTYDGTTDVTISNWGSVSTGVGSETLVLNHGTASFSNKDVGTAKTVTATGYTLADGSNGGVASNYALASNSATTTADIIAKTLTVDGVTADNKVYDGTTTATSTLSSSGIVSGDSISLSGSSQFDTKNAGIGKTVTINGIALRGADASNYALASTTATTTADITAKTLTVDGVTADNKVYDGTTTATSTLSSSGIVSGDSISLSGSSQFDTKNAGIGKTVTINGIALRGADASNYALASTTATTTADITAKTLTVDGVTADNKVYDGTTDVTISNWGGLSGLVGSETLTLNSGSASFSDKDVGTAKTVTATGYTLADGSNGGVASNYALASNSATTTADIYAVPTSTTTASTQQTQINKIITSIINKSVLTNTDLNTLINNGMDIQTLMNFVQQSGGNLVLIPGITLKVLSGGINLPFGNQRVFNADNTNNNNQEEEEENRI